MSHPTLRLFVVLIDLQAKGVRFAATASGERRQTVSAFAKAHGAQLAINADFFSYDDYSTEGLAVGDGIQWPGSHDTQARSVFAFGEGARVELKPAAAVVSFDATWMRGAISGKPELLREGVRQSYLDSRCWLRHPRTGLGLTRDGKTLVLVVVDGRSDASVGMTCEELTSALAEFGAWNAINLDGGGSSELYLSTTGIANTPSDGAERPMANHLAVFADPSQ